ncbi:MAG: 2-phospho-L-lactate guanylyltransferase [Ktedonobacterales bacterium]
MTRSSLTIAALVPLNAPALAKTRLAGALSPDDRRDLTRWLAARVITAVNSSGVVTSLGVVSPDPETLAWAQTVGATPLLQTGGDLNAGLALGKTWASAINADALLITLGDLPTFTASEARAMITMAAASEHTIVLAPDRASQGTNALLARPPEIAPLAFGAGSFARHMALARQAGADPQIFTAPGTAFDVDTSPDLAELRARGLWAPRSHASVYTIGHSAMLRADQQEQQEQHERAEWQAEEEQHERARR